MIEQISVRKAAAIILLVAGVALGAQAREANAQAWVGDARSLSASLDYTFGRSTDIVETTDISIGGEPIVNHNLVFGAEYVPISRLALSVSVPYVMTKYEGNGNLFPPHGRYDNGQLHAVFQDLRIGARYQVLEEVLALTPHIGVTIPMSDYETVGYAGAGRHLKQLHLGASIGRTLEPIAPNLYLHGTYEFTLSERYDATEETEEVGQNRSDIAAQIGYLFFDGKLDVHLGANFRFAHGGIHFIDWDMLSDDLQMYHDPLLHEQFILLGGGLAYAITDAIQISALVRLFVSGENTRNANVFGIGVSWDIL